MKYPMFAAALAATWLTATAPFAHAQETGGFKGFLKRTADAVMGSPSNSASGANGRGAVTDGAAFRPIAPASGGSFEGIFRGYSPLNNPGKFPRVSLYFESFGASEACWRTRATIWTSAQTHREETFDLCNAPLTTKDDLGNRTVMTDPTTTYLGMMARQTFAPGIPITPDRTEGPNPPRIPFLMDFGGAPNSAQLRGQYQAILARAIVLSGYGNSPQEPLFWVGGFNPSGNRDQRAL